MESGRRITDEDVKFYSSQAGKALVNYTKMLKINDPDAKAHLTTANKLYKTATKSNVGEASLTYADFISTYKVDLKRYSIIDFKNEEALFLLIISYYKDAANKGSRNAKFRLAKHYFTDKKITDADSFLPYLKNYSPTFPDLQHIKENYLHSQLNLTEEGLVKELLTVTHRDFFYYHVLISYFFNNKFDLENTFALTLEAYKNFKDKYNKMPRGKGFFILLANTFQQLAQNYAGEDVRYRDIERAITCLNYALEADPSNILVYTDLINFHRNKLEGLTEIDEKALVTLCEEKFKLLKTFSEKGNFIKELISMSDNLNSKLLQECIQKFVTFYINKFTLKAGNKILKKHCDNNILQETKDFVEKRLDENIAPEINEHLQVLNTCLTQDNDFQLDNFFHLLKEIAKKEGNTAIFLQLAEFYNRVKPSLKEKINCYVAIFEMKKNAEENAIKSAKEGILNIISSVKESNVDEREALRKTAIKAFASHFPDDNETKTLIKKGSPQAMIERAIALVEQEKSAGLPGNTSYYLFISYQLKPIIEAKKLFFNALKAGGEVSPIIQNIFFIHYFYPSLRDKIEKELKQILIHTPELKNKILALDINLNEINSMLVAVLIKIDKDFDALTEKEKIIVGEEASFDEGGNWFVLGDPQQTSPRLI